MNNGNGDVGWVVSSERLRVNDLLSFGIDGRRCFAIVSETNSNDCIAESGYHQPSPARPLDIEIHPNLNDDPDGKLAKAGCRVKGGQ
jgi:hypothetical protein